MPTATDDFKTLKNAIELNSTEVEPCRQKVEYKISREIIDDEEMKVLKEIKKMAQIPGFRKGKAPAAILKKHYSDHINEELMRRFYTAAFEKFSENDKFKILTYSMPGDEKKPEIKRGEDFSFTINFDTEPDFKLPEYKGLKIDTTSTDPDEKEIEERLEYFKDVYAEYKDVETPAEKDDMLKVAYTSDFELPENADQALERQVESEENWVWLSEPETIPGCIKALTGAEKGKEYEFEAEYPDDFKENELKGKKVKYKLTVKSVQRRQKIESEEELTKKMQAKDVNELRERIKSALKADKEREARTETGNSIYEKIEKEIQEFPFPPAMLESEIQKELRQKAKEEVKTEEDSEKFREEQEKHKETAKEEAKKKLRKTFILKKIADAENIKIEENEMNQQIKAMSSYYRMNEKNLRQLLENSGGMGEMQLDMLNAKVMNFLIDETMKNQETEQKTEEK